MGFAESRRALREGTLRWITTREDEFARTSDDRAEQLSFLKCNGELATVAAMLLDAGDASARPYLERCWSRLERGVLLRHELAATPSFAATYPPFWRYGLRDRDLEQAIVDTVATVQDPALCLLLACALRTCELPAPWDLDRLLSECWLAGEPATWRIDEREAYVMSHVVFLLAPHRLLPERHARYIMRSLPAWIATFVRAGDLDLLAELIMVAHTLDHCVPACEWQVLFDAQESDGMVPFRAAWRNRVVASRVRFVGNYHSTLVALAASIMCTHD